MGLSGGRIGKKLSRSDSGIQKQEVRQRLHADSADDPPPVNEAVRLVLSYHQLPQAGPRTFPFGISNDVTKC